MSSFFNSWKELLQLPRDLWLWAFGVLINRMGTMVLPFLALYLTKDLGFSTQTAGLVLGLYGGGAIAATLLAGWLSGFVGPIRMAFWSLLASALILIIYPAIKNVSLIFLLTLLFSITNEAFRPSSWAAVTSFCTHENRRLAFTLVRIAINMGMSLGPALGGILFVWSPEMLFWVDGGTSLLSALIIWFYFVRKNPNAPSERVTFGENLLVPFKDRRFVLFFLANLPFAIVFFQGDSTSPLFFANYLKQDPKYYGLFFTLNTLLIICFEVPLTSYIKRFSYERVMAVGGLLMGLGFGSFVFAWDFASMAVGVAIWTVGEMALFPSSGAYVTEIAPDKFRTSYLGMNHLCFNLAYLLAPPLGIFVLEKGGPKVLWPSCVLMSLIGIFGLYRLRAYRT